MYSMVHAADLSIITCFYGLMDKSRIKEKLRQNNQPHKLPLVISKTHDILKTHKSFLSNIVGFRTTRMAGRKVGHAIISTCRYVLCIIASTVYVTGKLQAEPGKQTHNTIRLDREIPGHGTILLHQMNRCCHLLLTSKKGLPS